MEGESCKKGKISKRKPNWNEEDTQRLATLAVENREILFSKFSTSVTSENKKTVWAEITKQINSESITCGTRDVDDVKKRWKDIKLRVKKKEAARKQGQRKTGGGPPPNVEFKPWEMEVLTLIPEESIIGLEGAVDTDLDTSCAEKSVDSTEQQSQESIVDPFIVYEVDIPAETLEPGLSETLTAEDTSSASQHARPRGKAAPKKRTNTEDEAVMSLVEVKRQRNAVEARKAAALERIATALEAKLIK